MSKHFSKTTLNTHHDIQWWIKTLFLTTAFIFLLVSSQQSKAEVIPPEQVIDKTFSDLKIAIDEHEAKLKQTPEYINTIVNGILSPNIDFDRVGQLALGKYWRIAKKDQKIRFINEFKQLIIRTYAKALAGEKGWKIKLLKSKVRSKKQIIVRTEVNHPELDQPLPVNYYMHLKKNRWRAYEVQIKGISLITNYRKSFSADIRKAGATNKQEIQNQIDNLIKKLADKNLQKSNDQIVENTASK